MGEHPRFWIAFGIMLLAFAVCTVMSVYMVTAAHAGVKDDAVVVTADSIIYVQIGEDSHCSGTAISTSRVLTASHCVEDGKTLTVKDSIGRVYPADAVYVDHIHDLALLQLSGINKLTAATAPLACTNEVNVGDDVTSTGYPHNQGKVTVFGKVSALPSPDADGAWPDVYRLQMFASPGSSGGAVFNRDGQVVAVIVGYGNTDPTGLGMIEAVPVADLCHPSVI